MNEAAPFSLPQTVKAGRLAADLAELTRFHYRRCPEYRNILDALGVDPDRPRPCPELPFLPVSLFKDLELRSIPPEEVFRVMTSSGTTGQALSKIYLDRATADEQRKALARIVSEFTGSSRLPMLIVDSPSAVKDRTAFSARGAGVLGFSLFGADRTYALRDDMTLDREAVAGFLARHQGRRILLFGFTFIIWRHFYPELPRLAPGPDFSQGVLIHGGGWKRLEAEAVPPAEFRRRLREACGLTRIHSYYGLVEQTGSIFMECEHGRLHASLFSEVIMRRPRDFSPCAIGEPGIIQVLSSLPRSYPGHSLLTEDEGVLLGEDDCPCGRKGRGFRVAGRLKNAEIRGCGDTYEPPRG